MITMTSLLIAVLALCLVGMVLPLVVDERRIAWILGSVGALASIGLLCLGGASLFSGAAHHITLWKIPSLATLTLSLDQFSALFLVSAALVLFPASLFAAGNLHGYIGRYSLRGFSAAYFGLFATIAMIPLSADAVSFLMLWESMSILTYLLVNFEHEAQTHTRSGYLMLAVGEAGTLLVALSFLVLARNGALEFDAMKAAAVGASAYARWAAFLLAFFGFGVKAGLIPVNFWLPQAYTAAPAVFTPVLAGATLNLGLYGIFRVGGVLLPTVSAGPGLIALTIGSITALLGILYATTQTDLKTLLAHSSIENAGIITAGFGAALVFVASGHPSPAAIALGAALYHMVNHSVYKTLLFFGAGSIEANAGARNLDKLGGLIKLMPWTALFLLVGALSISGLPPFNGFVSEWLTLQTLLQSAELASVGIKVVFALCGAILALTAALAVTCFVRAFAMGFLGMPRSEPAAPAGERQASATAAMAILAMLCIVLGVAPTYVIAVLDRAMAPMGVEGRVTDALVPPFFATNPHHRELPADFVADFRALGAQLGQSALPGRGLVMMHRGGKANSVVFAMSTSYMAIVLVLMLLVAAAVIRGVGRRRRAVRQPVWAGGIRRLLPEMTYTATGFSNPVRVIFEAVFMPATVEDTRETVGRHFRAAIRRSREENHVLDRLVLDPTAKAARWIADGFALMHHGFLNAYVAYGLLALAAGLLIARFS
jgi:hydrogenase-4 component B